MEGEKEKKRERKRERIKKEANSRSVGDTFVLLSGWAFFRFVKASTTWLISQKQS